VKKILMALAGLALAATSLAQLTKYKDWDKGPEAYFLTSAERAEWKKVATDQDAEQFIALYWRSAEASRSSRKSRGESPPRSAVQAGPVPAAAPSRCADTCSWCSGRRRASRSSGRRRTRSTIPAA
jgi:hypothetical protein